ncbi:hypothetical protein [Phenylobacterium sp.]|uniref:hypothetical protein n=1 Tax=Phenylobacterium sp. TaxID=1871053 RepID=UPI0025D4B903|nr:hypothetical protein [Phenylobacterium sp.]
MTTKFEAELIRHLAEPADAAQIDVSRGVAATIARQARTRRRAGLAAAGACTILTALAVVAGFGFADRGLPRAGLTDASLLWLPFAILAAMLTAAGATLSASLMRSIR